VEPPSDNIKHFAVSANANWSQDASQREVTFFDTGKHADFSCCNSALLDHRIRCSVLMSMLSSMGTQQMQETAVIDRNFSCSDFSFLPTSSISLIMVMMKKKKI